MKRQKGFTLIELLVVVAIIALLIGILLPSISRAREIANRTACAANFHGIAQALAIYANTNKDKYPKYATGSATTAKGFDATARTTYPINSTTKAQETAFDANVTAALWIIVRDGSTSVKQWVCPSDRGAEADPLQAVTTGETTTAETIFDPSTAVTLDKTYDFASRQGLSYSPINMYHPVTGGNWGSNAASDWVLMGDDNNAETATPWPTNIGSDPGLHVTEKSDNLAPEGLAARENSLNHSDGEGQNFMYTDGHAGFEQDPFHGPSNDNAMALDNGTTAGTLSSTLPLLTWATPYNSSSTYKNNKIDVCLMPITGNDTNGHLAKHD